MFQYFALSLLILSLTWQIFGEESIPLPEQEDADFGVNPFNDTDGNIVPRPRFAKLNIDDKSYTFIFQPATWHAAVEQCNSQDQEIASITNDRENVNIISALQENGLLNSGFTFWVGGSELGHPGKWSWINTGHPALFTNWRFGEPNNAFNREHCVELLYDGQWNDNDCDTARSFICQRRKSSFRRC